MCEWCVLIACACALDKFIGGASWVVEQESGSDGSCVCCRVAVVTLWRAASSGAAGYCVKFNNNNKNNKNNNNNKNNKNNKNANRVLAAQRANTSQSSCSPILACCE
jgi:hypothetical protein